MTGLVKAKQYDWKDSNLAMFGSDTEKQVKKESAESEPAWKGSGQKVGIRIWRIVKFKVNDWPREDYGKFYSGDSYIILNTYKDPDGDALLHDLHFWIGKHSTQDEYGTAAYKTVELDTFLDDAPVQHREVQGYESSLFRSYFTEIVLLQGGAETGFRHVTPVEYIPRLFHFHGAKGKPIKVNQIPCKQDLLDSNDVYVLDMGLDIFQWNGKDCNKDEKWKATLFVQKLKGQRGKAHSETLEEGEEKSEEKFLSAFENDTDEVDSEEIKEKIDDNYEKVVMRVSDSSGELKMEKISQGPEISRNGLDASDVFLCDSGKTVFVWVGKGASQSEKKNGFSYAHSYLQNTQFPLRPITIVGKNDRNKAFLAATTA